MDGDQYLDAARVIWYQIVEADELVTRQMLMAIHNQLILNAHEVFGE